MQLITAIAAFAGLAAATPFGPPAGNPWGGNYQYNHGPPAPSPTPTPSAPAPPVVSCLTNATATNLITQFGSLLTNYQQSVADAILTVNYTDTSDSILWLGGAPLGGNVFTTRAGFEAGQSKQPALAAFNTLAVDAVGCTTAAWRWTAQLAPGATLVKGINILYATNLNGSSAGWQINHMYSEFNNALWDTEIGGSCTPP